jgi:putative transposase
MKRNSENFLVGKMCETFDVSESAYFEWLSGKTTKRQNRELQIKELVQKVCEDSRYTYGSPRVWNAIQQAKNNPSVSRSLIARVMSKYGFVSCHKKKFKVTTDSKHNKSISENVLNREFEATKQCEKWVSDITYIQTNEGWLYLTTVIDLFDRKVVGWSLSNGMTAQETVVKAWRMAVINRPLEEELIFHSDRGVQYASNVFRNILNVSKNVTQSMSRKGNCWDNAVAESFFKTIKVECIYRHKFKTRKQAELVIFDYIEAFYNQNRIHTTIKKTIKNFAAQQKGATLAA